MSSPSTLSSARGRLAVAVRDGRHDDAARARADLAAALAEREVQRHLPVLRDEDRLRLAAMLVAGVSL